MFRTILKLVWKFLVLAFFGWCVGSSLLALSQENFAKATFYLVCVAVIGVGVVLDKLNEDKVAVVTIELVPKPEPRPDGKAHPVPCERGTCSNPDACSNTERCLNRETVS